MKESELHNLYKVSKSRNIKPKAVVENLNSNGRQIYLHFIEEVNGIIEFEGFNKVEDPATYKIKPGKVYPLTPDSRIDLVKALSQKRKQKELKIRIIWEDNENNGYFIIKVKTKLKSMLVIDYEDLMQSLHGIGYEGWIVVEAEQDPKTANPLIYAKKGLLQTKIFKDMQEFILVKNLMNVIL